MYVTGSAAIYSGMTVHVRGKSLGLIFGYPLEKSSQVSPAVDVVY